MEKPSVETERIEIEAVPSQRQHEQHLDFRISKEEIIRLLKKHGVAETKLLESPDIGAEDVVSTLRKAKVKVPEGFFADLATAFGLPFMTQQQLKRLCSNEQACRFLTALPYRVIEDYLIIPLEITKATAKMALANPLDRKALLIMQHLLGERQVTWVVASLDSVEMAKERVYSEIHKKSALLDLYYRNPDESAYRVLTSGQKMFVFILFQVLLVAAIISSAVTFAVIFAAINVVYFLITPLKIYIAARGFQKPQSVAYLSHKQLSEVKDDELPVYTVLVPVYREAAVLPHVMRNLYRMDYPKDKLDVKILMEEKDEETLSEARKLGLFGEPSKSVEGIPAEGYREFLKIFEPVVIPVADITTKPRACNYGLLRARGKYCVIFDAEDNPDEDQLRKAAVAFSKLPNDVVCLQSKLNFYNAKENALSGWFSIEYSYWYDYYLEGLDRVDVPIPLGGTSNHFRVSQLRDLGGWDPYNVTEDADIGIRLSRRKLRTAMLDCYTYEEATIKLGSWIRQRSRWYKGHAQTYLVHMRHPIRLLRELGWRKFLLFQFTFGGGIYMPIINPFLWIITAVSLVAPGAFSSFFLLPIEWICVFNLVVGNLSFLFLYLWTCVKQRRYYFVPLALTMPVYWVLISIGAWRGLLQLITRPFYWEKTLHGVSQSIK
ncbi:MAG: glycosyltransferase [Candidatus Bathyarchaeota archaeon]|nr:glycosyltransferase [Candidatus Bathyarchaeota archaeon]